MASDEKFIQKIRNNPKDVRFEDACRAAELIGFVRHNAKSAHTVFKRVDEIEILNFQKHGSKLKPYQARQLIVMLDKYWQSK